MKLDIRFRGVDCRLMLKVSLLLLSTLKLVDCNVPSGGGLVVKSRTIEEKDRLCESFTRKHDDEFYSPMYPNDYPNSLQCIRVIEGNHY
jgi:hypothetical protein